MTRTALALAASLLALAARAAPPSAPAEPPPSPAVPQAPAATPPAPISSKPPVPRGAVLEEVSGTVREIDRTAHRLSVDTANGPVTLSLDRNTMVYTATGLATVLDVAPGVQIRAGRNAEFLAYWVQVRSVAARQDPPSTPGQGTGPAGGGSAPAGESGGAPGAASPPTTVPGGVPPGATPPAGGIPAR